MSYQVLARKWRPRSFREMVGQTHVLRALINALDQQRLHHAYLFTGTRGVGKTTIARILAKCLNCETGISSTPCGQCSACREIDEGRFVDLIEVDAASRTKVEDTRELLENVQYAPSRGRYKVYLIDEVHMLSTHSFNALLKTLEEPPPHVKFLLATTDPQKLPVTVLSRCLQFALKNMPPERVVEHLQHVLSVEQIPFEDDALWLLGRAADGSMRDAMSLTDQAIAFGEGRVQAADVRAMLGSLDHRQVFRVLDALVAGQGRVLLDAIRDLAEQGPDWHGVLAELLNALHRVAIAQLLPDAVDNGQGDREQVLALARRLPSEDVQFYYQMGLIGRRDLPLAPDPRSGFEMVMLRMLAFRPADGASGPAVTLEEAGERAEPEPAPALAPVVPAAPAVPLPAPVAAEPEPELVPPAAGPEIPEPEPVTAVAEPVTPAVSAPESEPVTPANMPSVTGQDSGGVPPWEDPAEIAPVVPEEAAVEVVAVAAIEPDVRFEAEPAPAPVELADGAGEPISADETAVGDEDPGYMDLQAYAWMDSYELADYEDDQPQVEAPLAALAPATGLAAEWLALFPQLGLSGMTASIASNSTLVSREGARWELHLDPGQSALFNPAQQRRLAAALSQHLGHDVDLVVKVVTPEQETPAQAAARRRAERLQAAAASLEADPLVQQMKSEFAATLFSDSIEPLDSSGEEA